jgi:flagellar basal-body rod protein FlgG
VNYGTQISASGAMTALYRMDVLSNNLANAGTAGYKPDIGATRQRDAARIEDGVFSMPSNTMLEKLGGGLMLARNRVNFGQGGLERTDSPLDVAIQGDGFFVVRDESDTSGDRFRLTRDGRFLRDAQGRLALAASGLPVMDTNNRPIQIPSGVEVSIDADGTIRQDREEIARIQVAAVPDRSALVKLGGSLFRAPGGALASRSAADAVLRQGHVESSVTNQVQTMLDISSAGRDFESNINMISQADRMLERAINTLGRVI